MDDPASSPSPRVSVIIPTLDGGAALDACLEGLSTQREVGPVEIVIVDSESRDGRPEKAAQAGAKVLTIAREAFRHGAARDQGARAASGKFLVFTVQDARPANDGWLHNLLAPLEAGEASASTSRILPRPEANPLARRTVLDLPMASSTPSLADPGIVDPDGLEPAALRRFVIFDDVASAIRTDVYREVPFRPVAMAEDLVWGLDALRAGHRIAFVPEAVVLHSHEYGPVTAYRRYREDAAAMKRILRLASRKGPVHALKGWAFEWIRDLAFLRKEGPMAVLRYALPALALRAGQILGQWKGSR